MSEELADTAAKAESLRETFGRLKEAAEFSGYAVSRTKGWYDDVVAGDRWRELGFDEFDEFAREIDLQMLNGSRSARLPIEQDMAERGATNRAIAAAFGVHESTVSRDLANASPAAFEHSGDQQERATTKPENLRDANDSDELDIATPLPAGQEQADAILADIDEQVTEQVAGEPTEDEAVEHETESDPPIAEAEQPLQPAAPGWHKLGDHLLYCGDSTDPEFIEACAGAAFAFADPPYNAGKADWDDGFKWRHDHLADVAEIVAVTPGIAALAGFLANTTMPYKWSMAAEITNGMTSGALRFGNWICVTLFAHGSIYRKAKDHMRIPVATGDDQGGSHPSRKPVRLLTHLIELFTTKGDAVVDPFLGSGTTLIAAERTGRRCVGAEIDPTYCAEIIARYHNEVRS